MVHPEHPRELRARHALQVGVPVHSFADLFGARARPQQATRKCCGSEKLKHQHWFHTSHLGLSSYTHVIIAQLIVRGRLHGCHVRTFLRLCLSSLRRCPHPCPCLLLILLCRAAVQVKSCKAGGFSVFRPRHCLCHNPLGKVQKKARFCFHSRDFWLGQVTFPQRSRRFTFRFQFPARNDS